MNCRLAIPRLHEHRCCSHKNARYLKHRMKYPHWPIQVEAEPAQVQTDDQDPRAPQNSRPNYHRRNWPNSMLCLELRDLTHRLQKAMAH